MKLFKRKIKTPEKFPELVFTTKNKYGKFDFDFPFPHRHTDCSILNNMPFSHNSPHGQHLYQPKFYNQ